MPALHAISSDREKNSVTSLMISIAGSAASRLCMMTTGAPCAATTRAMSGSRCRPHTSLTMAAPASSAQAATSALIVSIDTGTPSATTGRSTGSSRCRSSASDTGIAPPYGRVDSAPISRMSAPSPARLSACAIAAFGSRNRPPSENESGVTLTTPITSGLALPSRRVSTSSPCGAEGATMERLVRSVAVLSAMACAPVVVQNSALVVVLRSIWALAAPSQAVAPQCGRRRLSPSIANDRLQFFGVFDPTLDCPGLRQQADLSAVVCFAHPFDQVFGIADFQVVDGLHAGGAQQLGIFETDALDPHPVGGGGPIEHRLAVCSDLRGYAQPQLRRLGGAE